MVLQDYLYGLKESKFAKTAKFYLKLALDVLTLYLSSLQGLTGVSDIPGDL